MRRFTRLLAVVLLVAACRSASWPPPLPSDAERAQFGDVAVTVVRDAKADVGKPTTGWAAGLGFGTVRGLGGIVCFAAYGAGFVVLTGGGSFVVEGAAVGAAVGVVYTPVSMVAGAVTAPSSEEIAAAEVVIRPLVEDPQFCDRLADWFTERARALTGRGFVPAERATTVVEISLVSITSGATWDTLTLNRPFEIRVEASARVVRTADGRVIWEATRQTGKPPDDVRNHTYVEWAANDGEALRREIDDTLGQLGTGFADSVFGRKPDSAAEAGARP
jgi:hypothetical protein